MGMDQTLTAYTPSGNFQMHLRKAYWLDSWLRERCPRGYSSDGCWANCEITPGLIIELRRAVWDDYYNGEFRDGPCLQTIQAMGWLDAHDAMGHTIKYHMDC